MDRPVTTRSRGICRYYTTPRGCFAGDDCKFLHGAEEKLTPYDKSKVCRYYAKGHCTRGDQCWFRHVLPRVASDDERIQFRAETCCICLEKPTTYGLLTDCSHVFCLECIRQWRSPTGKSPDVVLSGTIKSCPLCRTPSRFITPSAHFFPNGSSRKKETIDAYKGSMARVPCKYFEETSHTGKPCCPFGIDCFYQHTNPDGTPHAFHHGVKHSMNVYRRHRLRNAAFPRARFDYDDPVEFFFQNPMSNLHATFDFIRASLPAFTEGLGSSNEPSSPDSSEDEEFVDDFIGALELLEDNLVMHEEATNRLSAAAEQDSVQSTPPESSPEHAPLPTRMPLFPGLRAISQPQPARPSSRFSTIMGTQSRQTFIIDISDDEEDEEDDESTHYAFDAAAHNATDSSDRLLLESTHPRQLSPEQQSNTVQSIGSIDTDMAHGRPQCEHDVDPPFMTDGRGRVVWSSTRNVPGRGTASEGRASRHSRTGSSARIACPSQSSHPVPNPRGHA